MLVPNQSIHMTFQKWRDGVVHAGPSSIIQLIRSGIDADVLRLASAYLDISNTALARLLGLSPTTLHRRIRQSQKLDSRNSEYLVRLALITDQAEHVFGSAAKATAWMKRPHPLLGEPPIMLLDTSTGATEVIKILGAIAHGGVI